MEIDIKEKEEKIAKHLGIVKFSHQWILDSDIRDRRAIYQVITPIRSHYSESAFMAAYDVMLCFSLLFRELSEGEIYPEYEVTLHTDIEGNTTVESVTEKK